ncbi:MAG: ectonucleotide pyrophosphatase/phosphodiesterase [Colwellia sp.]|nr:ectonucleotide pyrophosphatase/phosphodiesterase [Colwellia sp.]MCW8863435.1 ectonucleotide pyrophosphatase/phosphodiesterase [Colwellia sp.]MCW9081425.1 ectonucleotide pyrophosphatase/phosphodiesterase [Colwellia sp.]
MSRFILFSLIVIISSSVYGKTAKSTVILLSIDGFAYNYLATYQPKNILAFAKTGTSAKLLPVYPSKTFPNHLSMITGVYPINHGIIHNSFYHPGENKNYRLGAGKKNKSWLTAQPIWSKAEAQGVKTGVYFWPESESAGQIPPSYNVPYNHNTPNRDRVDQIITWLKLPKAQRPNFIASYFSTVDTIGHQFGPNSRQLAKAVKEIDELFGYFIKRLKQEITQPVNIVLVSDHGMTQVNEQKSILVSEVFTEQVKEFINTGAITMAKSSTQLYLYFNRQLLTAAQQKAITDDLTANQKLSAFYSLYHKSNFPDSWHLNANLPIIPDIILEAVPGATFKMNDNETIDFGAHGYDPTDVNSLTAIFIASGPDIHQGRAVDAFENINIAPFIIELLGLKQNSDIDGKASVLSPLIK